MTAGIALTCSSNARRATALALALALASWLAACGGASSSSSALSSTQSASTQRAATQPPASGTAPAVGTGTAITASTKPCGSEAAQALARTVGMIGERIYRNELGSSEVFADKRQIEGYAPLLAALARGDAAATKAAVTSLVYSHTHIVRLRVTHGSQVLADVGGPYIIAPVEGVLRSGGTTLAHYAFSVQDDLGYVKLVTRFIGVPIALRVNGRALPVEGVATIPGGEPPALGPVTFEGRGYEAYSFATRAYPNGELHVSLLAPLAGVRPSLTCDQIATAELASVAQRIAARFKLSSANYSSFIDAASPLTGGLIFVRSGSHQLAGSAQPGPAALPQHGTVRYRGATYEVSSFTAPSEAGTVRIYQLVRATRRI